MSNARVAPSGLGADVAARRFAATLGRGSFLEGAAVIAGFGLLAVLMTWPLAREFSTDIVGGGAGGDASGYVWDYWSNANRGLSLWGGTVQDWVSAPFGRELPGSVNATLLVSVGPAWVVTKLFSPIAAYNVVALSGMALTGASMYLLIRWLRLGVGPALWAGVSFVLFPYEIIRVLGHLPLSHLECFPLMIMAGLWWLDRPGWRRAAVMALACAFGWLTNPYYGVMCGVMLAVFVAWGTVATARRARLSAALGRLGEAAAAVVVVVLVPLGALFLSSRDAVDGVFRRDEVELLLYGAQLTDYIRPLGSNPMWDTVFGSPFQSPSGERLNYLGAVTIVLALAGIAGVIWRRRDVDRPRRTAALIAIPMVPVLVLFSLASPMTWLGVTVDMPSRLVFEALPFLRGFARFVAPVMAIALVAGAVGLWLLVRNRSDLARISILVAALMATAIELPPPLPLASAEPVVVDGRSADQVPTWAWLRDRRTDEIVFELPGTPNPLLERYYMYGQTLHGHRIANGGLFPGQLGYDFVNQFGDVTAPGSPAALSTVGIDLVTVSPWSYAFVGAPAPDPRRPSKGFAPVRTFEDGSAVWRVDAAPLDGVAVFRTASGWPGIALPDRRVWRWLADEGRLTVVVREPGDHRLRFRAVGLVPGATYRLEFTGPDGAVTTASVTGEEELALDVSLASTRGDVTIRNLGPPAQPIGPGGPPGSVRITEPVVSRA